jgi:cellulose synthase/poly-beta-1,6-N-acetylglucosamine synthase-like glycosyltransferase
MKPTDAPTIARDTAAEVLSPGQARTLLGCGFVLVLLPILAAVDVLPSVVDLRNVLAALVAVITTVYVVMIGYKTVLVLAGLRHGVESSTPDSAWTRASASASVSAVAALPTYTILVPLYKEAAVLRSLIRNLSALDYPRDLLQVLLLIEEDDEETISGLATVELPAHCEIVMVPESFPRTKPKACNVGLARATGSLCVIYDAEDRPDPAQLRKAVDAFSLSSRATVCVQAELQYFNPATNVLTRWFAAEYACNFSLILPGLTRLGAPVPLGGTSNHFRTEDLRELGGWDEYNVTEDADLGIWIARHGWRVAVIDSVTWEEANSRTGNWVRQRSRWIKGYLQTYFVHMRHPYRLLRQLGPSGFLSFQCVVGGTPFTLLANPLFWGLTTAYVLFGQRWVSDVFPAPVFYLGIASMVIGNFLSLWYLMLACMKRGLYPSVKWVLAVPAYWALMSLAAAKAASQLMNPRLRHHWEKTTHGLIDSDVSPQPAALDGRIGLLTDLHPAPRAGIATPRIEESA